MRSQRILAFVILGGVVFAGAGCGRRAERQESRSAPPMAKFIDSLQRQDLQAFLSFFSKKEPFHYVSTITDPPQTNSIQFNDLKFDLENRKGWHEVLFDAGGDDCFRDWAVGSGISAWTERPPHRFVRQVVEGKDTVYVEWRREGDSWVVAVIAEPSA